MKKNIFICGLVCLVLTSCGKTQTGSSDGSSDVPVGTIPSGGGTTTVVPPTTATIDSPLNLQVYTVYDKTSSNQYQNFDGVVDKFICKATKGTPSVTCTLNIPEGRLYYSSLNFQLSWNTNNCKILHFQPYYYTAWATNGDFLPYWSSDSAIQNCLTTPTIGCFGGAAPQLISDFPKHKSILFLSDESKPAGPQSNVDPLTIKPANSLFMGTNRLTANNLAPAKRGVGYAYNSWMGHDAYVASSMVDYTFFCEDDYADPQPYVINLIINDVDSLSGNTVIDNVATWAEAP